MGQRILFFLCGVLLIVLGCNKHMTEEHAMRESEKTAVIEAVEARVAEYIEAYNRLDVDQMFDFWADTDGFAYAGDGALSTDFTDWAGRSRENTAKVVEVNWMEINNPVVCVLSREAAVYAMEYAYSMTMKTGETINVRGSWLYVFKKFDDAWRVVQSAGTHINESP